MLFFIYFEKEKRKRKIRNVQNRRKNITALDFRFFVFENIERAID